MSELPNAPLSRIEGYLNNIATGEATKPAAPLSRIEQYLDYIAENGGGGGDAVTTVKLDDLTLTMSDISALVDEIKEQGKHVFFDTSAFEAMMYLTTIYVDKDTRFVRVCDMDTGIEKKTFYKDTDLFKDILNGMSADGHYTFVWDKVNAKGTRANAAANITTTTTNFGHFGSVNANYDNPFDSIYPWSERKLCNVDIMLYHQLRVSGEDYDLTDVVTYWEGEDGFSYDDQYGVWVYTPPFFGRTFEAGNYRYFDVTAEPTQGNIAYPAMITGRWHGCRVSLTIDGTEKNCLLPMANGMPAKGYAVSTMHAEAKNYSGTLTDIYKVDASILLMIVEYATMNSQSACGNGVDSLYRQSSDKLVSVDSTGLLVGVAKSAYTHVVGEILDIGTSNGGTQVGSFRVVSIDTTDASTTVLTLDRTATGATTDSFWSIHGRTNTKDAEIGSKSGYIGANTKSIVYYRGEELWANLWQYVLGAYREKDTNKVWIAARGTADNYNALDTSVHTDTGVILPENGGYIKTLGIVNGLSCAPFCAEVGGNAANPVGDYLYMPSKATGNTVLLLGGNTNNGANDGCFYGNWNNTASNSNWNISARPTLLLFVIYEITASCVLVV